MIQELVYTSAPKGLRPGSRGFCTVASTPGMARNMADLLESLSGYRHLFGAQDANAAKNPVAFSHLKIKAGGSVYHVLSRVADAGFDYTRRSNKIAHHVVVDDAEPLPGDPATVMSRPEFFLSAWSGEPRTLAANRRLAGTSKPGVCTHWKQVTGDAGWGGAVAQALADRTVRQVTVIFEPGMNLLPLVSETLSLLPSADAWNISFSTYFTKYPPGIDCRWRFLVHGSSEAVASMRLPHSFCLNLCEPARALPSGPLVKAAQTGVLPVQAKSIEPVGRKRAAASVATANEPVAPAPIEAARHKEVELPDLPTLAPQLVPPRHSTKRPSLRRQNKKKSISFLPWIIAGSILLAIAAGSVIVLLDIPGRIASRGNTNEVEPTEENQEPQEEGKPAAALNGGGLGGSGGGAEETAGGGDPGTPDPSGDTAPGDGNSENAEEEEAVEPSSPEESVDVSSAEGNQAGVASQAADSANATDTSGIPTDDTVPGEEGSVPLNSFEPPPRAIALPLFIDSDIPDWVALENVTIPSGMELKLYGEIRSNMVYQLSPASDDDSWVIESHIEDSSAAKAHLRLDSNRQLEFKWRRDDAELGNCSLRMIDSSGKEWAVALRVPQVAHSTTFDLTRATPTRIEFPAIKGLPESQYLRWQLRFTGFPEDQNSSAVALDSEFSETKQFAIEGNNLWLKASASVVPASGGAAFAFDILFQGEAEMLLLDPTHEWPASEDIDRLGDAEGLVWTLPGVRDRSAEFAQIKTQQLGDIESIAKIDEKIHQIRSELDSANEEEKKTKDAEIARLEAMKHRVESLDARIQYLDSVAEIMSGLEEHAQLTVVLLADFESHQVELAEVPVSFSSSQ